jgi:hypothetical protein
MINLFFVLFGFHNVRMIENTVFNAFKTQEFEKNIFVLAPVVSLNVLDHSSSNYSYTISLFFSELFHPFLCLFFLIFISFFSGIISLFLPFSLTIFFRLKPHPSAWTYPQLFYLNEKS